MKKIKPLDIEVVAPIETWSESTLAFLVGAIVKKQNEIIEALNEDRIEKLEKK